MRAKDQWLYLAEGLKLKFGIDQIAVLQIQEGNLVVLKYNDSEQTLKQLLAGYRLSDVIKSEGVMELNNGAFALPYADPSEGELWFIFNFQEEADTSIEELESNLAKEIEQIDLKNSIERTQEENEVLRRAIELQYRISNAANYKEATLILADYIKISFNVSQVVFGWVKQNKLNIIASDSGSEISKKTEFGTHYESLMTEAYDQEKEIILPEVDGQNYVVRQHLKFGEKIGTNNLISIPVKVQSEVIGVISVIYFEEQEEQEDTRVTLANQISLVLQNVAESLSYRKYLDETLTEKAVYQFYKKSKEIFGPRYLTLKVIAALLLVTTLVLALIHAEHRIDGEFSLQSFEKSVVVSPMDSTVNKRLVEVGDWVEQGADIIELSVEKEVLERDFILNKIEQYKLKERELLAVGKLSELNQVRASLDEALINLELVTSQIRHGLIKAPISGYIVEIYSENRLNEPVQHGTPLFKMVSNKDFFARIEIDERDLQYVEKGSEGELAFKNNPDLKFPIRILDEEGIVSYNDNEVRFINRASLESEGRDWFKDGMTGVAKVNAGKRSLLWILTRRTYLYLRLKLWW